MATADSGTGGAWELSRRDFLKTSAAVAAVAGCGLDFAFDAEKAMAYEGNGAYTIRTTTCPYCSASCGQRVVVENSSGNVVDIYGDFESPFNTGGFCSKGAGSFQLVTNSRRIGAWEGDHPLNVAGTIASGNVFAYDSNYASGVAYKRTGNQPWEKMDLQAALTEMVGNTSTSGTLLGARGTLTSGTYNSKGVAFLGSSHMDNEPCYIYRKLIANFGSSNVEHQARI